jgi:hypothetical protein
VNSALTIIDPDMKEGVKASFNPFSAATAVLVLAYVATFIPMKPQTAEVQAPTR